jgi:hypothetical protein
MGAVSSLPAERRGRVEASAHQARRVPRREAIKLGTLLVRQCARARGPHQLSASRGPQREVGQPWQARDTNGRQRLQTTRAGPRMRGRAISNSRQSSVPEPLLQIRSAQGILNTIHEQRARRLESIELPHREAPRSRAGRAHPSVFVQSAFGKTGFGIFCGRPTTGVMRARLGSGVGGTIDDDPC